MLEKDIENLIARYPQDFFPKESFIFKGQQIKLGSCFADLVFGDKFDRFIIIEIKRGILTREAAGQIMEYYGRLKEQSPDKTIELILCANIIPNERRRFLETVGIECKELGLSLITEIAKKRNYRFLDNKDIQVDKATNSHSREKIDIDKKRSNNVWIFQGNPERFDVVNALSDPDVPITSWRVRQYRNELKIGDIALIWVSGKDAGIYAITKITSEPKNMPIAPGAEKYWIDQELKEDSKLRVQLKILKNLINTPVLKTQLKKNSKFSDLSIMKFAQGTAFRVTGSEWEALKEELRPDLLS